MTNFLDDEKAIEIANKIFDILEKEENYLNAFNGLTLANSMVFKNSLRDPSNLFIRRFEQFLSEKNRKS